ncbi:hypothetical protein PVAND_006488 [Polypedilum vanderplanki]|uniref:CTCHY-type domain-containing protein n=1 Tax=Polypedilum vanderplanki TaxID=319348 RepID=A0A9J6C515_POLVA|nr:hypothetical protein PVAND_006488 [Polypedilum vanderplanki]
MKDKESVEVIINDLEQNPNCIHGPTILFLSKKGKKYFSCSAVRDKSCFYLEYEKFERYKNERLQSKHNFKKETIEDLRKLNLSERIFCATCGEFIKSIQSHEFHSYKLIDNDLFLQQPSLFLPQLNNDKVNAQYFFDNNTLEFFKHIFNNMKLKKIICMGTPRLHDFIRTQNCNAQSILLDIDERFQAFYPEEFICYNMLNNYFINGNVDEARLFDFIKEDTSLDSLSHHCLIMDPPFAARTELLCNTIKEVARKYFIIHKKILPIFVIYPYFNENHVKKVMPEMEMLEYQVTYMNHYAFNENYKGRKEGSPIRIFTNIDQRHIKYPSLPNYRFCKFCHRFVALNNLHCRICKICPSKNGATYHHCNRCIKCVKPNYVHCEECDRCVQKTEHECKTYQIHQECWYCFEKGHVEKYCKFMKKHQRSNSNGFCRICKDKRHNLITCPSKNIFRKAIC